MATETTNTLASEIRQRAANRTSAYGESIWYSILQLRKRHKDPIYFGDGAPAAEAMPIDRLRHASAHAWEEGAAMLGYGESEGYQPLREFVSEWMKPRGIDASPDDIMITAGSTQGIEAACRVMLNPGDTIIVENPTFLGAIEIFESYEVRIVAVDMDEHGMRMDSLQQALESEPNAKMIYTIPTFHNPTGTSLPVERRKRLLELAREHKVLVIEDDPYESLQYDGEVLPPLRALDENVVHLGSFSKTIAPAVRTGWAVAPQPIFELMLAARQLIDLHNDRVAMRTVYFTAQDFLREHVESVKHIYKDRRDAMLEALKEHMPEGTTWSEPNGGFFVWVELPEAIDVNSFDTIAADHGVIYFPGNWFMPAEPKNNVIRLSFSTVPEERIREGVKRLGDAVRAVTDGQ